jgi:hypothetical protein
MLLLHEQAFTQQASDARISIGTYMDIVDTHNDIQESREELLVARTELDMAKVSPSPTLVLGNASGDISGINMPHQIFAGVEYSIEAGGKRKSRIRHANATLELARIKHEIFVRTFKKDAWLLYHRCWIEEQQINAQMDYIQKVNALRTSDSLSAIQKRITVQKLQIELSTSMEKHANSLEEMNAMVSHAKLPTVVAPLLTVPLDPDSDTIALTIHEDNLHVLAQKAAYDLATEEIVLAKNSRKGDYSISIGNNFVTRGTNPEAPSPAYNAITAFISIPFRFSSRAAEVRHDKFLIQESEEDQLVVIDELKDHSVFIQEQKQKIAADLKKIAALINSQEKLIALLTSASVAGLLEEMERLYEFREMQWEATDALANTNGELFWYTGKLPMARKTPVASSK